MKACFWSCHFQVQKKKVVTLLQTKFLIMADISIQQRKPSLNREKRPELKAIYNPSFGLRNNEIS